mgnify:CR=1 FL=1
MEELVGDIWTNTTRSSRSSKAGRRQLSHRLLRRPGRYVRPVRRQGACAATTVSGWVMEQVGRVPEEGDHFQAEGLDVIVTRVEHRRVIEIQVRVLPEEEPETK